MGEIAEMMLDGTLCQYCGEYIGSDDGYPQSCGCEEEPKAGIGQWFHYNNKSTGNGPALDAFLDRLEFTHSSKKGKRDRTGKMVIYLFLDDEPIPVAAVRCANDQFYQSALRRIREVLAA